MKVVFFGTPEFAAKVLQFLVENQVNIVAVVTKPDKPKGRSGALQSTPVKDVANALYLPVHQPEKASSVEFAPILEKYKADLFVVVAYGEIIKQHLLDMPKLGCINAHASLLPKYRGAAPIQYALINGEKETGVTIQHMVLKMDAGDIIKVAKVSIGNHTTAGALHDILCEIGSQALLDVIIDFQHGKVIEYPQDPTEVTMAPKIELEDCEIDWSQPAEQIHNLVRGVYPHPGAWCMVKVRGEKKRLKIHQTHPLSCSKEKSGTLIQFDKNGLAVACGKGAVKILSLQLEGKKRMTAKEFVMGSPDQLKILYK